MQIGEAILVDVLGTAGFMLTLLLFLWFLASWIPASHEARRFTYIITGLVILSTLLAEAGIVLLGWTPPWQESGIITPSASMLDLIVLPLLMLAILGAWFVVSRLKVTDARYKFSLPRVILLILSCLFYEVGMLFLGWPAPWHLPIPPE